MEYTIKNEQLQVTIGSYGAELHSIRTADGTEYLWQSNPRIWEDQAPNIFPYVARLTDKTYTFGGREYHMEIHGFINSVELTAEEQEEDRITLRYDSCEESLAQYPFVFTYRITYALEGNTLHVINQVENRDDKKMYFGIGGHPGFRVPLEDGLSFEDYYLEFTHPAVPTRVGFSEDCFLNGKDELFPLEDGTKIPLRHNMFDEDAIVLKYMDRQVTLKSDKGSRGVRVTCPDYTVLGFWHMPRIVADYICIEPWSSLPSRKGVVEDLAQQADLASLESGKKYRNEWTIELLG